MLARPWGGFKVRGDGLWLLQLVQWFEWSVGIVAIDRVERVLGINLIDGVKRIVRVDAIDRIRGISWINAVDGIKGVPGINRVGYTAREKPSGEPRQPPAMPSLQIGARITWLGADGKPRGPAAVDFIHTDSDGSRWAFCTLPEGWYAVNLRFATMAKEDRG